MTPTNKFVTVTYKGNKTLTTAFAYRTDAELERFLSRRQGFFIVINKDATLDEVAATNVIKDPLTGECVVGWVAAGRDSLRVKPV